MRKTIAAAATAIALASAPAFAADLPMKARPLPPAPVWSWTGFYIGGHVGFGWGQDETRIDSVTTTPPGVITPLNLTFNQNSRSGVLGGGQAGYNWQAGWFVLGVQADIAALDVKGTDPCLIGLVCTSKSDWLATVTGRIGAVVLDRGLVYVKAGGAWLDTNHTTSINGVVPPGVPAQLTNGSFTNDGWVLGFGTEWMITQNWTAFVETDYMRFEDKKVAFTLNPFFTGPVNVRFNTNQTQTLAIAKVGVNYKFGWGSPVVAKY
jgi:outer membrane immunogenic protein